MRLVDGVLERAIAGVDRRGRGSLVRVLPAVEGDQVTIAGKLETIGVYCGCSSAPYFCLTCRAPLANYYQAELHTVDDPAGGRHTIARSCTVHGLGAL